MKGTLLAMIVGSIAGSSLFIGGGTYALMSASGPYQLDQISADTVELDTASFGGNYNGNGGAQQIQFPMFYTQAAFPNGPNPYDVKTRSNPSGELPGRWAPGESVTRYWTVDNEGGSAKFTGLSAKLDSLTGPSGDVKPGTQTYNDFLNNMIVTVYSPSDGYRTPVFTGTFEQIVRANQPLTTSMYLAQGNAAFQPKFVVTMNPSAGNDLQAVTGVLDFSLTAEACQGNWFDPDGDNNQYQIHCRSTTSIKFECYDSQGRLEPSPNPNVCVILTGPNCGKGIKFTLGDGLTCSNGHYEWNLDGSKFNLVQGRSYTATIYNGSQVCSQEQFTSVL